MSDNSVQMTESLSALMDGEASEFEVRKLIRVANQDGEIRTKWQRYHLSASSIRKEPHALPDLALCDSIHAAIEQEAVHGTSVVKRVFQPLSRFAVAASVAAIAIVGVQQYTQISVTDVDLASNTATTSSQQIAEPVQFPSAFTVPRVPVRAVSASNFSNNMPESKPVVVLRQVDAMDQVDQQQVETYLNELMRRHTENAAVNGSQGVLPFARMPNSSTQQP